MDDVNINYKISHLISESIYEPSFCVTDISGDIYAFREGEEFLVGKVKLFYCDLEKAFNNDISTYDVLDAHSSNTERYYYTLFDPKTDEINRNILDILGYEEDFYCPDMNFLIIDRLELLPTCRGKGLSKLILEESIKLFSNRTFAVVLQPFPLQEECAEGINGDQKEWFEKMQYDSFTKDAYRAQEALIRYYKKLGFTEIPNSEFLICTNEEWI
jgi:GNAT superfamily N-acetyltransferase